MSARRDMALYLAARGLAVFRCRHRDKRPIAYGWQQEATGDPAIIRRLFEVDNNIGVACGTASNIFVVDLDGEKGETSLFALEEQLGPLPTTFIVETPNGLHHYFRWRPGIRNSAGLIGSGIDIRGQGGYVIGPGSLHPSGGVYQIAVDAPIAGGPLWLLRLIDETKPAWNGRSAQSWRAHVSGSYGEGERNSRLAALAGLLLRRHIDPHVARELLIGWNAIHCQPPLPADELERTLESIAERELRRRAASQ